MSYWYNSAQLKDNYDFSEKWSFSTWIFTHHIVELDVEVDIS